MIIERWARDHGITPAALEDLRRRMGAELNLPKTHGTLPENVVQASVRIEATRDGCALWRNNVGVAHIVDPNGKERYVRYGLCNEFPKMNERLKSSDLIGIKPVVVLPSMVGITLGVFMAREVKKKGWKYTGKGREAGQMRFIELVNGFGGDAKFTTGVL